MSDTNSFIRPEGHIQTLPSGSLRVIVYAGKNPLTGKRHDLTETVQVRRDVSQRDRNRGGTKYLALPHDDAGFDTMALLSIAPAQSICSAPRQG
ncbi:hypothetical protein [Natronoglycomyces albus]|uniref:Uncharacterized protein n=1 Tax=Natronoglycomyces albus TaxID=2811108 RepID=A0A895XG42_9ACTN|nr:hypothetical protein [Natronoglycomyces albus]QSB03847.1 hypothetical protein JQS30_08385 [Natronoglycomyces albus]